MIRLKDVLCLEVHRYAPELNKLHLFDGSEIRTPQITQIDNAIKHANYENSK